MTRGTKTKFMLALGALLCRHVADDLAKHLVRGSAGHGRTCFNASFLIRAAGHAATRSAVRTGDME